LAYRNEIKNLEIYKYNRVKNLLSLLMMPQKITQYIIYGVVISVGLISVALGFDEVTLGIHSRNSTSTDVFFTFFTHWGEWPIISIAILTALWKYGWKNGLFWGIAFAAEGLIINGLKLLFNKPRPVERLTDFIRQIDGIELAHWKSFPSGHTAAVFFGTLMLIKFNRESRINYPVIRVILLIAAFLVGYSRIYLGQHHIEDVVVGSLLGLWLFQLSEIILNQRTSAKNEKT